MGPRVFAAADLGATSGRVIAGVLERDRFDLHEMERFHNRAMQRGGHLRWNLTEIYHHVVSGLRRVPEAESLGVDGWGVDYGLLDEDGRLLAEPIAYRDSRTAAVIDEVHHIVPPAELYSLTGTQFLSFNTIYQIACEQRGPFWSRASHAVLLPDLLAYWLTGNLGSEVTNASTTGLLDIRIGDWSSDLLRKLKVPEGLFPPIVHPGTARGATSDGIPVVTVGSHDTASAILGIPATTERFAYISSGTWSLVGLELEQPVLTEAARQANFTNERGVGGRTRFLRNVAGLWLFEECLRDWGFEQRAALIRKAARLAPGGPTIDPDDPALFAPGDMPERIVELAVGRGNSLDPPEIVRCIFDSLAAVYARTLREASALADREIDVVHIVGGGSRNGLLCQLTADAVGLRVVAGPAEATAFGNVAVQAWSSGATALSIEEMRLCIAASSTLSRFEPT